MKICALLLAKAKSSFENKNIYPTLGHPLMAYPMLAAKNVDLISECFISSDSKKYLRIGKKYGYIPILRNPELAQASSRSDDVVVDSVLNNDILKSSEIIIVQHANVGTIHPELILKSIEILSSNDNYSSVVPSHINQEYNPYRCFWLDDYDNVLRPVMSDMKSSSPNRQQLPKSIFLDHSFWVIRTKNVLNNTSYISPWRCLGDKINPLFTDDEMFDVHDIHDIKKTEKWIKKNYNKLKYLNEIN